MCLDMVLIGLILLSVGSVSWIWMSVSWARLGQFSALISSNKCLPMFSPFFLSSCYLLSCYNESVIMLDDIIEFPLPILNFFFIILFSFCCWALLVFIILCSRLMIHSSVFSSLLFISLVYFKFQLLNSSSWTVSFLYFLSLC